MHPMQHDVLHQPPLYVFSGLQQAQCSALPLMEIAGSRTVKFVNTPETLAKRVFRYYRNLK